MATDTDSLLVWPSVCKAMLREKRARRGRIICAGFCFVVRLGVPIIWARSGTGHGFRGKSRCRHLRKERSRKLIRRGSKCYPGQHILDGSKSRRAVFRRPPATQYGRGLQQFPTAPSAASSGAMKDRTGVIRASPEREPIRSTRPFFRTGAMHSPMERKGRDQHAVVHFPIRSLWDHACLCGRQAHLRGMYRSLFRILARINKAVLPKLWHRDLRKLSKLQMAMAAWRYYVTKNAL